MSKEWISFAPTVTGASVNDLSAYFRTIGNRREVLIAFTCTSSSDRPVTITLAPCDDEQPADVKAEPVGSIVSVGGDHWTYFHGEVARMPKEWTVHPLYAEPQPAPSTAAESVPADPMDWRLPCDVTVGHGTIGKGCSLRTLVMRMQVLYDMARDGALQPDRVAADVKAEPACCQRRLKYADNGSVVEWEQCPSAEATDMFSRSHVHEYRLLYAEPQAGRVAELEAESARLRMDAGRYQMLRRGQHWSVINGIGDTLRGEELDAAIDAALAAKGGE